jgi:hypothetical protein
LYVLNRMEVSGDISALQAARAYGNSLPRIAAPSSSIRVMGE